MKHLGLLVQTLFRPQIHKGRAARRSKTSLRKNSLSTCQNMSEQTYVSRCPCFILKFVSSWSVRKILLRGLNHLEVAFDRKCQNLCWHQILPPAQLSSVRFHNSNHLLHQSCLKHKISNGILPAKPVRKCCTPQAKWVGPNWISDSFRQDSDVYVYQYLQRVGKCSGEFKAAIWVSGDGNTR